VWGTSYLRASIGRTNDFYVSEFMGFLSTELAKFILASSVLAALVTSIFNFINIRSNNKRLIELEKLKKDKQLIGFRYHKLYEASIEIRDLKSVKYDLDNREELFQDSTDRFHAIESIFIVVKPILDKPFKKGPSKLLVDCNEISKYIVQSFYGGGLEELLQARLSFEESVIDSIEKSIESLTNN
jgi:hypothetical protein